MTKKNPFGSKVEDIKEINAFFGGQNNHNNTPATLAQEDIQAAIADLNNIPKSLNYSKKEIKEPCTTSILMKYLPGIVALPASQALLSEKQQIEKLKQMPSKDNVIKPKKDNHYEPISLGFYNRQIENLMTVTVTGTKSLDDEEKPIFELEGFATSMPSFYIPYFEGIGEYQRKLHNAKVTCHELLNSASSDIKEALSFPSKSSIFVAQNVKQGMKAVNQFLSELETLRQSKKDNIEKMHILLQGLQQLKGYFSEKKLPNWWRKIDFIYNEYVSKYENRLSKLKTYYEHASLIPANSDAATSHAQVKPYEIEFTKKYRTIMDAYFAKPTDLSASKVPANLQTLRS